jgi:hypothetical protein
MPLQPGTEAIVGAAADFLWSAALAESVESFTRSRAGLFAGAAENIHYGGAVSEDSEHNLGWTEAHKEFSALFEQQLEDFVVSQDFSQKEFVAACQVRPARAPRLRRGKG